MKSAVRKVMVLTFILVLFGSPALMAESIEDEDISRAVETELVLDEAVPAHLIDVETIRGVVTLSGSVSNVLARRRAEEVAGSIKGVRSIVNDIDVKPIARSDEAVARDVEAALLEDPAADSYEVDVSVNSGLVRLSGTVQSWQENQLAEKVALGVKGVTEVDNDLIIEYETKRSDYEIKKDVESRLKWDKWIEHALIDVKVNNGEVSLSGTVGTPQQRRRARSDAWVTGVDKVEDSLKVRTWARSSLERTSPVGLRSDAEIAKAVKDAFVYDPRVVSFNIDVEVDYGVVTLSGIVEDLAAKRAAKETAQNTVGALRVKNHLKVRPPEVPSNDVLEQRVSNSLSRNPYVEIYEVDVDAANGLIYLSGDVTTSFEKEEAARVAEKVKGVVAVQNNIDYNRQWEWKTDWNIAEDVRDQMWWSPYVEEEQVSVTVENGIVTLRGKVDSWSEFHYAEDNAYEGGAKDVINKLRVKGGYGASRSG